MQSHRRSLSAALCRSSYHPPKNTLYDARTSFLRPVSTPTTGIDLLYYAVTLISSNDPVTASLFAISLCQVSTLFYQLAARWRSYDLTVYFYKKKMMTDPSFREARDVCLSVCAYQVPLFTYIYPF